MGIKAIDANNAVHDLIVNKHLDVIETIEKNIDKAISEARFSCASSFTIPKSVLGPIKDHFQELGYLIQFVNNTPRSTIIAVSWDDSSLSYARSNK